MTGHSSTDRLIGALRDDLRPVAPLPHPLLRAGLWLLVAAIVAAAAVLVIGPRPNLAAHLGMPHAMLEWVAAVATAILAAIAAFFVAVPGRSLGWALLPVPSLLLWLASIGWGCLSDWVRYGPEGLALGTSFACFLAILAMSVPTGALMLWMLRSAGRVRPTATLALGMLATGGLASAALTLFHHLDATIMVLIWHGGTVAILVAVAALSSRPLFRLVAPGGPDRGRGAAAPAR